MDRMDHTNISKHFLDNEDKDPMKYSDLPIFQQKDVEHRTIIAKYCVQDTALVQLLIDKLQMLTNQTAMSQVCGIRLKDILSRGASYKTKCLILKETYKTGYLFPIYKRDPTSGATMCSWHNLVVNAQAME